jgi:hypothetical protein
MIMYAELIRFRCFGLLRVNYYFVCLWPLDRGWYEYECHVTMSVLQFIQGKICRITQLWAPATEHSGSQGKGRDGNDEFFLAHVSGDFGGFVTASLIEETSANLDKESDLGIVQYLT